jgi:hypothetical protein
MKRHGMIFNAEMVRAILDGRKTQTRRMVKPQPPEGSQLWGMPKVWDNKRNLIFWREGDRSNYGKPLPIEVGDIIWVRETWSKLPSGNLWYRADNHPINDGWWTPSIHMPRWASRIDLEVTAVRVERVQEISEEDAKKEGVESVKYGNETFWKAYGSNPLPEGGELVATRDAKRSFGCLWQSIYANWDANPWVWVYEFRRVK